jgi:DNA-directed RNA polymerase subunit RPC12/RpoP
MQVSQYLCSTCGSVLKETAEYIEIHSIKEECPTCGSMLSESLERRPLESQIKIPPPMIQKASTLLRLRFDIPKFDSFMGLGSTDLCCITGYHSNLILTRLCVRSLLPERYGGLNSPYALLADTGNRTDVYRAINFARQYGLNKEQVGDRILVIRAFTVSQVIKLLSAELPRLIRKYHIKSVVIPGLLNTVDEEEPSMKEREAEREIGKIMKSVIEISSKVLVMTSIQREGKYADWVLSEFKKHINLVNEKDERTITAELNNRGDRKTVSLIERDLKIIHGETRASV